MKTNRCSRTVTIITLMLSCLLFPSCDPLVDTIDAPRETELYHNLRNTAAAAKDTVHVMSWNIRFGCGSNILWFGDACGSRTVLKRAEVTANLDRVIEAINTIRPDIVLLQEVDRPSKRSAYIDQLQYIMDRTYFRYGAYATNWKSQFIPSDGLGRIDEGNAVLSVWPITATRMYPLPLRGDMDALTKYFYVREIVMTCTIQSPGFIVNVANTHLSAFSTDDTKQRQVQRYMEILAELNAAGTPLITGGDFNLLPPHSDSLDYCNEDACPGETIHLPGHEPLHKEGSNYAPEISWLDPLYASYHPSLPLALYAAEQNKYFTHATFPHLSWDRTLDYLFSNRPWISYSHIAHQYLRAHSDHAPVSAKVRIL